MRVEITHSYPDFNLALTNLTIDTTRGPRPGEKDGLAYHFISKSDMLKKIAQGDFLEHAVFSDNMYGTSRQTVQDVKDSGKICILDIDLVKFYPFF